VDRADAGSFEPPPPPGTPPPGDDTSEAGAPPDGVPIVHLDPVSTALAAGGLATCAIDDKGGVLCWGDNTHGTLGFGDMTPTNSDAPMGVKDLSSGVRAVAGGPFAQCAILLDGTARCWGDSLFGDVQGSTTDVQVPWPHDKLGLSNDVAQISFGDNFACALTTSGRAKCWGYGGAGQLGTGTTDDTYFARDIAMPKEAFVSISTSMGGLFACAAGTSGKVYCWGENGAQQLGTNEPGGHPKPAAVPGIDGRAIAVGAGRAHACALYDDGAVACWGGNEKGQLGSGTKGQPLAPMRVAGIAGAKTLVVGADHACATLGDGSVSCWGATDAGQITAPSSTPIVPTQTFSSSFGAIAVGLGFMHTCAMSKTRHIRCQGADDRKQIGKGDFQL
jgi:alpha-tubulin suppressor-like RCC1 family protein